MPGRPEHEGDVHETRHCQTRLLKMRTMAQSKNVSLATFPALLAAGTRHSSRPTAVAMRTAVPRSLLFRAFGLEIASGTRPTRTTVPAAVMFWGLPQAVICISRWGNTSDWRRGLPSKSSKNPGHDARRPGHFVHSGKYRVRS